MKATLYSVDNEAGKIFNKNDKPRGRNYREICENKSWASS